MHSESFCCGFPYLELISTVIFIYLTPTSRILSPEKLLFSRWCRALRWRPRFFLLNWIFFTRLDFWGQSVGDVGRIFLGPSVQHWLEHSWVSFLIQEVCVCVCKKAGRGCGSGLVCTWYETQHWCHVENDSPSPWQYSRAVRSKWSFIIRQKTFGAFLCHAASPTWSTAGLVLRCWITEYLRGFFWQLTTWVQHWSTHVLKQTQRSSTLEMTSAQEARTEKKSLSK